MQVILVSPSGLSSGSVQLRDEPPELTQYGPGWSLSAKMFLVGLREIPTKWVHGYAIGRLEMTESKEHSRSSVMVTTAAGAPIEKAWKDMVALTDHIMQEANGGIKTKIVKPAPAGSPKPEDPSFYGGILLCTAGFFRWLILGTYLDVKRIGHQIVRRIDNSPEWPST